MELFTCLVLMPMFFLIICKKVTYFLLDSSTVWAFTFISSTFRRTLFVQIIQSHKTGIPDALWHELLRTIEEWMGFLKKNISDQVVNMGEGQWVCLASGRVTTGVLCRNSLQKLLKPWRLKCLPCFIVGGKKSYQVCHWGILQTA